MPDSPIWRKVHSQYFLDMPVQDHRCSSSPEIPHSTYCVETSALYQLQLISSKPTSEAISLP